MATGTENQKSTIILVIWRHLLNLSEFKKPDTVKITVVGPSHLVVDESQIDIIHHVEGPITPRDQNHTVLMQKVRELCAALAGTTASTWLCVFERSLQREVAQIREEFDIEGPRPEQFDQLSRRKDIRAVCRRGGLTTLRCCSFGSVQGKPDAWVECANSQVGQYPMFLRPVNAEVNCMHTLCIAQSSEDLKSWIRARPQSSNYCVDYLVEECLENGYEFIAVVSCKTGLIGAFCTTDQKRTLYMSVKSQSGYGIEYLNAEQTRDALPGVESFVMQSMKTVFSRSLNSVIFIKGFYRGHNSITFMGGSLELRKHSLATLFKGANHNKPWEVFSVEELIFAASADNTPLNNKAANGSVPAPSKHCALINFPNSEGFLLHQTKIAKRKSDMRLVWRVSEGEELLDSDGIDENVLQIFLNNTSRAELLEDVEDFILNTDIAVDRLCLIDKRASLCHRLATDTVGAMRNSNSGNQLVRSCTTAD